MQAGIREAKSEGGDIGWDSCGNILNVFARDEFLQRDLVGNF